MSITILHNETSRFGEFSNTDTLTYVFGWESKERTPAVDHETLNVVFEGLNIGEHGHAAAYRARGLRSLSVGDVVVIDHVRAYAVTRIGWAPLTWDATRKRWTY